MLLRITFCLLAYYPLACLSQSNCVSSGGNANGSNGNVSYTIGQIDYQSFSGTNGDVNLGVQQPYEIYKLSLEEVSNDIFITIGPNPTNDAVTINFQEPLNGKTHAYIVSDDNGKKIIDDKITEQITIIDLSRFSTGTYFLTINKDNSYHSYKILKNNTK